MIKDERTAGCLKQIVHSVISWDESCLIQKASLISSLFERTAGCPKQIVCMFTTNSLYLDVE